MWRHDARHRCNARVRLVWDDPMSTVADVLRRTTARSTRLALSGSAGLDDLAAADLTLLGTFYPPDPTDDDIRTGNFLAVRNIAGADYLYSCGFKGYTVEYPPVADGSLTLTPPFPTATASKQFGDIFQLQLFQHAADAGYDANTAGLAGTPPTGGLRPGGLFWDEIGNRMYWAHYTSYQASDPTGYDTNVGRGTIDRGASTGTGEGMWGLAYTVSKFSEPITNSSIDVGGRWVTGYADIPTAFANAYCSGRRLLAGFGTPAVSTATTGPTQIGAALFAFDPDALTGLTNHTVLGGQYLTKLAAHPFTGYDATVSPLPQTRGGDPAFQLLRADHPDIFYADTDQLSSLCDLMGQGVWIQGATKQGLIIPGIIASGNCHSTILASPAPSGLTFTVDGIGDGRLGDYAFMSTDGTMGQTYNFARGLITDITDLGGGHYSITVDAMVPGGLGTPGGPATVGGFFHLGARYFGGGSSASRFQVVLMFYSIDQLAEVATGQRQPDALNPIQMAQVTISGRTQPWHAKGGEFVALTYSSVTKRLYLWSRFLYEPVLNTPYSLVQVFTVDC